MKVSSKKVVATIVVIILLALGGLCFEYYFLDQNFKQQKKNQENQINDLRKQLEEEKKKKEELEKEKSATKSGGGADGEECVSTLTAADLDDISLWQTIENATHHYSFKYPQTWSVSTNSANQIVLSGDEADINFQVRSGPMSEIGFGEYHLVSSEDITVACENAHKTTYSQGSTKLIVVSFTKSGTPRLFMISYSDVGASISGDIIDAYNLILKTVEFE